MLPVRLYCVQHPSAPVGIDGFRFLKAISGLTSTLAIGIGGGYLDCPPWSELRGCFQRTELAGLTTGFINFVSCLTDFPFGGAFRPGINKLRVAPSTAFSTLYTPGVYNVALVSAPASTKPEESLRSYDAVLCTDPAVLKRLHEQGIQAVLVEPDSNDLEQLLNQHTNRRNGT